MNRRKFLRHAATGMAAAPYVITSAALGAGRTPAASDRVGLGHIGVGGRGGALLGAFLGLRECKSIAIADPFQSRREPKAKQVNDHYKSNVCTPYNDFRRLLERKDIDGVIIATPDHWHVPTAMEAARAGKDMYVEKPLGLCVDWDIALRKVVERYGSIFQYGTQQRSSRHLRHACELVLNGRVGKVHTIDVVAPAGWSGGRTKPVPIPKGFDYDLWLGPAPVSPYTHDRCDSTGSWFVYDNAIGFLGGWGAHPLDIAIWGCQADNCVPVEYEGTGFIPTEGLYDTVKTWKIRGRYANGVKFSFVDGGDRTTFIGDKGKVSVSRGGLGTSPGSLKNEKIGPNEIRLIRSGNHGQNFVDGIKTRSNPVSNLVDAVKSDTISHLSDIAIRTGRKIKWDPKKEKIIGDDQASRMLTRPLRSPWAL